MGQRTAEQGLASRLATELIAPGQTLVAGTVPGVIAGSVIRVELLPGPRVFDLVVAAVLVPLGSWLATTRPISAGDSGRPVRPILAPCHSSWRSVWAASAVTVVTLICLCAFISMTTRGKTCRRGIAARRAATPPALSQRHPLEILEATDIEPCSLKADKDGRICQRPLGDHQGRSSVVSARVARNSSDRPVVSGPSRASSRPISDAGSHCRRRESGMIFATGRLSLKTSISSPASTRRKTSAVWLRSSRAGMAAIGQVQSGVATCVATPDVLWWCAPRKAGPAQSGRRDHPGDHPP